MDAVIGMTNTEGGILFLGVEDDGTITGVHREQDNSIGYVRQTGIDKVKYEDLVMKLAKQQGYITRDNVSDLLNITNSQAYRVLKKLADKKKLILVGKGRAAQYELVESGTDTKVKR